ncbi:substrate-binding periplasmic protein [Paraglaciecola hydrolytica]|uniref:Solute-binding protein family 3/N-terminal domain-containing protein n=1 Tax=Paraglaciecola hydrolytica TaxID=1799789 RepID=A0A135ZYS3_9ALTE|nr:transporter substrate-binding domain-containing protein [Paraglaciecola hydrolytica]KXI28114.1 hypothetical protein AX660_17160 [Paraglaciecola hydrolytica]
MALSVRRLRITNITSSACVFIVLFFSFCSYAEEAISAADLTYYTENYPPSNYLENGKLVGISVETLKLIWKTLDVAEQKIHVVPWARGYSDTLKNKNTVLFTTSRTLDRESLFKWVGPIYTAKHVLVARADFKHNIVKIEDAYRFPVAAIRNDISELALVAAGFPKRNIAPLTNLQQALLLLANGRLDLIIISRSGLKQLLLENNLQAEQFQIVIEVNQESNYFAFNKQTPDFVVKEFQQAFDSLAKQHQKLLNKYGLSNTID